ncbi:hypothetical protein JHD50_09440 [Sulfurimonas sp. MAG313]|nr:hypothetical protein [Sulfurimonas sp. MAG313]MDF1881521.1 hypothetical protein [Sulfurimonas sp. MAG313]
MRYIVLLCVSFFILEAKSHMHNTYKQSKTKVYTEVSYEKYQSAIEIFIAILKNPSLNMYKFSKELSSLGLEVLKFKNGFFCILDKTNKGGGFYIINETSTSGSMLSAPHRFHDFKTGSISYKLMIKGNYKAAAFNTVHRKIMDAAHTQVTLFNAFHIAFSRTYPQEAIYQLHGFSNKKRSTLAGQEADIIISNGSRYTNKRMQIIQKCLIKTDKKVALYGKNIFELGGTKNIQYKTLSQESYRNFVHIELNLYTRKEIVSQAELIENIIGCLP